MKINEYTPDTDIFKNVTGNTSSLDLYDDNSGTNNVSGVSDFGKLLKNKLDEVNSDQVQADNSIQSFVSGDNTDIHNVMMDAEQAKMSLELAVQMRNKLVDAYQELNRTQL
ncbi:flagellar hook-basal body complex protein FliE [Clostridium tyrobutyricum]|uniref:flagellar hook-basal body complex protein FliE n=1 Tax=Clostridium tyrobutyricum TaxID=1519 RepID=UPI001C390993|nr:flagellar hook-basal body complex protein FliE [Clostridium tyrobutyricum]MBV4419144.1 flagellar hook-basal body complex protein FliE [Clostridium tyrobutyricum]